MIFYWNCIKFGLFLVSFRMIAVGSDDSSDFQKSLPALLVWGVPGQDVDLPCDVTASKNDQVSMVLWFKDSTGIPVYSLDARGGPLENAIHWAMSNNFGSRSNFCLGKGHTSSRLTIKNVIPSDQGIYRCRIDFNNSPTKNSKVNLTMIVQPSEPIIYDAQGREVVGVAGPFMEGYDLFLACHVLGGRPRPKVSWWSEDQLLDDEMETLTSSLTVNQYFRPNVSRSIYNSKLKCKVSVVETSPSLVKEVQVEVYLKPRWVKMNVMSELLSSGRPQQYQCDSWGSVPPAKITWLLEGEFIRNAGISVTQEVNLTTSVLTYRPSPDDDGKELTCRAENPRYPGSILEDSMELTVLYPPYVSIFVAPGVDPEKLREGDEIRFFCKINSNPKPTHVSWFQGDMFVHHNPKSGIFITENSLDLRNLTREQAGEYSCAARNSEGEARSDSIAIRILYPPRCKDEFRSKTVGALRRDTITIRCEVNADPPNDVKFSWTFNKSGDVLPLPATRIVSNRLSSHVEFTPISDSDFGTLACWAVNSIGRQTEPCMTHIFPARIPQAPQDCKLKNYTSGGLQVICVPGQDGGLQQHFMLEVLEFNSNLLENSIELKTDSRSEEIPRFKVLGSEPEFVLRGLESGMTYTLSIYAINAKGRSEFPFVIPGVKFGSSTAKLRSTENMKNQEEENKNNPMVIILGALIGIALLIIVGIATAAGFFLCKKKNTLGNNFENAFNPPQKKIQKNSFQVPILSDNFKSKKINNSTRQSVHEILPLDELAALKPFGADVEENVQTAVIKRNRGASARQIRNSLSLSLGNHPETGQCKPVNLDTKPLNLGNLKNFELIENEENTTEEEKRNSREDTVKKSYARVTLNPEGEVMKCIIEGSKEKSEEKS